MQRLNLQTSPAAQLVRRKESRKGGRGRQFYGAFVTILSLNVCLVAGVVTFVALSHFR